jgi:hypothetical protein
MLSLKAVLASIMLLGIALAHPVVLSQGSDEPKPEDVRIVEVDGEILLTWKAPDMDPVALAGVTYVVFGRTNGVETELTSTKATFAVLLPEAEEYGVAVEVEGEVGVVVYAACRFWFNRDTWELDQDCV